MKRTYCPNKRNGQENGTVRYVGNPIKRLNEFEKIKKERAVVKNLRNVSCNKISKIDEFYFLDLIA